MRVVHLSHSSGSLDGGIATAVADLAEAQRQHGLDVSWLTAAELEDPGHPGQTPPAWRRDRVLVAASRSALSGAAAVLHLHGLWRSPTRCSGRLRDGSGRRPPLVVAPHGMLDPWALGHSRWKKRLVWRAWERRALERAGALQALCPAEADSLRALGLTAPIALIPNGVRLPSAAADSPALPAAPWASRIASGERVVLFLSRFHAKKGLDPLLRAWAALGDEPRRQGWWLALVGYGDDGALAARVAGEGPERVLVLGPCFGAAKEACLAGATAFILPSFSEGLPMAALEAMAHRLPCLLSPACNLPEAFQAGAALAVSPEVGPLAEALRQLFRQSSADSAAMGEAGRRLVQERFSWQQVATRTAALYDWLHGAISRPEWIQVATSAHNRGSGW